MPGRGSFFGHNVPVCPECGAYVSKERRHRKWHKKQAENRAYKPKAEKA